ncbi:polysaccharide pyruvyl transferase family protein [Desulfopila sp. IMCC35008]|uniref:polysaccharide pyruvyl transferase family protein n=1 Tax=Desulfopila sp. IMCC35008 TaxID=2653858 RepID=UPI0013D54E05|nr:polysaccharide pyruvyl transferase family protein [Desulfopila sp. IMCC35008]
MKKVGILNFHFSRWNYGAILQASALDYAINREGYQAEHIDLVPKRTKPVSSYSSTIPDRNRFADNPEVFDDFRNQWMHKSQKRYETIEELENASFSYDGIVVGSDGVWSYNCTGDFWSAYFIQFADDTIQKISYAPSFGMPVYDAADNIELVEDVKRELARFNSISVREISGIDVLKKTFKIDTSNVVHVLDPTLLVGESYFQKILDVEKPDVSHISKIVYHKATHDPDLGDTLRHIEKEYDVKPENILSQKYNTENDEPRYKFSTVPEWILKIKNSQVVITDSYHCVCLAILFRKKLIHLPSPTSPNPYKDCRLISLFGLLKQNFDQISVNHDSIRNCDLFEDFLHYPTIENELAVQRKLSLVFLKTALRKL